MMGIFLAMFLLGTLFLVAALVSSPRMSRRVFNTRNKNICGRVFNGIVSTHRGFGFGISFFATFMPIVAYS